MHVGGRYSAKRGEHDLQRVAFGTLRRLVKKGQRVLGESHALARAQARERRFGSLNVATQRGHRLAAKLEVPGEFCRGDRCACRTLAFERDADFAVELQLNRRVRAQMIDEGKPMVLVDTMPYDASYRKEHIPGAKNFLFPVPRMSSWDAKETDGKTEADFTALLGEDKDKPVVFYCGFVKCTRSDNGAAWARKLGYTQVYRFPGGLFSWKGADFPLEAVP